MTKLSPFLVLSVLVVLGGCTDGCRGSTSKEPPVHLQRNMFTQDKGKPQRENTFFSDHRTMRPPVEHTISTDAVEHPTRPQKTLSLIKRGQERYNIYCAPCHGTSGFGEGSVPKQIQQSGTVWQVSSLHEDDLKAKPDEHYFDVISKGIRTMPSYAAQIPFEDRWAIVSYVRALQRSQKMPIEQVPETMRRQTP